MLPSTRELQPIVEMQASLEARAICRLKPGNDDESCSKCQENKKQESICQENRKQNVKYAGDDAFVTVCDRNCLRSVTNIRYFFTFFFC